jgi:hypothetical protein
MIKAAIGLAGVTQSEIAKHCGGIRPTTVSMVVNGVGRSKRVELRISEITGLKLAELWPDWYGPSANRARRPALSPSQIADALRARAG